jgi:hypothetical protein
VRLETTLGGIALNCLYGQEADGGEWVSVARQLFGLDGHESMSPTLEERLCFTALACGSYEMASQVAGKWGVQADDSTIHAHVRRAGTRARELSNARVDRALDPATRHECVREAARGLEGESFSLIIMADGWMAREKGEQWGLKPPDCPGNRVAWREIKTAIVFRVHDRCDNGSGRPMLLEKFCVAWQGDPHELGRKLHAEALRRGLAQAIEVFVVADGGIWIWNIFRDRFANATGVLDFFHASQHLWAVAHELYGPGAQAATWVEPLLHQLRHGGEQGVLNTLEELVQLCEDDNGPQRQCLERELGYLQDHADHIHYCEVEKTGCPCGSGAMESTCAQLQTRFKRPGQFWAQDGLLNLLELELYRRNKDWDKLWPVPT